MKTLPCQRAVCTSSLCKHHDYNPRDKDVANTHVNSCISPQKLKIQCAVDSSFSRPLDVNVWINTVGSAHTHPVCEDKFTLHELDVASTSREDFTSFNALINSKCQVLLKYILNHCFLHIL